MKFNIKIYKTKLIYRWLSNLTNLISVLVTLISFGIVRSYIGNTYFFNKIENRNSRFDFKIWVNFNGMVWMWLWKLLDIPCIIASLITFGIIDLNFDIDGIFYRALISDTTIKK